MKDKPSILTLYLTFLKIGFFTIGGGYAMLPMLHREFVENRNWATEDELMDYYAIGQSTPGIIAINTATFVGLKYQGLLGGIVATLGMITPSWVIITIIANFMTSFHDNIYIQKAFYGVRIAVVALIISAILKMKKNIIKGKIDVLVSIFGFIAMYFIGLSPILIILIAGAFGLISFARVRRSLP